MRMISWLGLQQVQSTQGTPWQQLCGNTLQTRASWLTTRQNETLFLVQMRRSKKTKDEFPSFMQMWSSSYHEATVALQGREEAVAAQAEAIETNLTLLGATAVEDRLQDGVPQAISTLSAAGIKVCHATSSHTAECIADDRLRVNGASQEEAQLVLAGAPLCRERTCMRQGRVLLMTSVHNRHEVSMTTSKCSRSKLLMRNVRMPWIGAVGGFRTARNSTAKQ